MIRVNTERNKSKYRQSKVSTESKVNTKSKVSTESKNKYYLTRMWDVGCEGENRVK